MAGADQSPHPDTHPLDVVGVRVDVTAGVPAMLLRESGGARRMLSIFIGVPEATAISVVLEGVQAPRPMTHDLLVNTLTALGASLERVVITELRDTTFYAELYLDGPGHPAPISARPSDAVALAVRVGCPVEATGSLLDAEGFTVDDPPAEALSEDVVEEFRQFIDQVSPEDFGS